MQNKAKIARLMSFSIYPRKKDKSNSKYIKTNKPVNIRCKKCTNPAFDPPTEFYTCLDAFSEYEGDNVSYFFDDINKDTIDITVNLSMEE